MWRIGFFTLWILVFAHQGMAQNVGISADGIAPDPSAMLDVSIESLPAAAKKGLLLPRMTVLQRDAIASPADGLLVYLTNGPRGFWYFDAEAGAWLQWGAGPWRLTGNVGTDPAYNFVGTTYAEPFRILANGTRGMRISTLGQWIPEGTGNSVLIGLEAGYWYSTFSDQRNVHVGASSGWGNGADPSSGELNTSVGPSAAVYNSTGDQNTALGRFSARVNQFGNFNTMAGSGSDVLEVYDWNAHEDATGVGHLARVSTWTTAVGTSSRAGRPTLGPANYHGAAALGTNASADTLNSTALGSGAQVTVEDRVRIGNTAVLSIGGYAPWTDLSDIRFKRDVRPLTLKQDLIGLLRPITYRLDEERLLALSRDTNRAVDPDRKELHTGLGAQELEAATRIAGAPDVLVQHPGGEDDHYGVRYASLVPLLVLATQERAMRNAELRNRIEALKARVSTLGSKQR